MLSIPFDPKQIRIDRMQSVASAEHKAAISCGPHLKDKLITIRREASRHRGEYTMKVRKMIEQREHAQRHAKKKRELESDLRDSNSQQQHALACELEVASEEYYRTLRMLHTKSLAESSSVSDRHGSKVGTSSHPVYNTRHEASEVSVDADIHLHADLGDVDDHREDDVHDDVVPGDQSIVHHSVVDSTHIPNVIHTLPPQKHRLHAHHYHHHHQHHQHHSKTKDRGQGSCKSMKETHQRPRQKQTVSESHIPSAWERKVSAACAYPPCHLEESCLSDLSDRHRSHGHSSTATATHEVGVITTDPKHATNNTPTAARIIDTSREYETHSRSTDELDSLLRFISLQP
ncbi:hypothetical protein ADUPG1_009705 [Aduncisulcus paluster]|uniref:Uncharacterized protein n=1 Tax=Aduncisulcus paluster TaxID=2918883 RepID=A0ABQ5L0C9_9EUKA|nr:hypothetical protein ADUPG1_009705 [Aduncisulcus paluster]